MYKIIYKIIYFRLNVFLLSFSKANFNLTIQVISIIVISADAFIFPCLKNQVGGKESRSRCSLYPQNNFTLNSVESRFSFPARYFTSCFLGG